MNHIDEFLDSVADGADRLEPWEWPGIQGLVLDNYHHSLDHMSHYLCSIKNVTMLQSFLREHTSFITFGNNHPNWNGRNWTLNISFTYQGLSKIVESTYSQVHKDFETYFKTYFPEFEQGLKKRAIKILGDDMEKWQKEYFNNEIHLIITFCHNDKLEFQKVKYPKTESEAEKIFLFPKDKVLKIPEDMGLKLVIAEHAKKRDSDKEHFGFRDGISQPWINGGPRPEFATDDDIVRAWTVVLHERFDALYSLEPATFFTEDENKVSHGKFINSLMRYGSFGAFRKMEQDVASFKDYLEQAATVSGQSAEWIGARMVGRWPNGTPLSQSQDKPIPAYDCIDNWRREEELPITYKNQIKEINNFTYQTDGLDCPFGAHIRRNNPRNSIIAGRGDLRRVMRRIMPYGSNFDAHNPNSKIQDRGLVGYFIGSNLAMQFEHLHQQWMNMGRFTGLSIQEKDPIVGANPERDLVKFGHQGGEFSIPIERDKTAVLRGVSRFVTPKGGFYTLIPGRDGLDILAGKYKLSPAHMKAG